jgi:hypothetical protein
VEENEGIVDEQVKGKVVGEVKGTFSWGEDIILF